MTDSGVDTISVNWILFWGMKVIRDIGLFTEYTENTMHRGVFNFCLAAANSLF